jgi:Glycine-zipper domain
MFIKWGIVLLGISVLSACVVVPTGPNVMVLPASGKPFEAFQADEAVCRQYARSQLGIEPAEAANQSAVTSGAIGTVAGAAAGALIGAAVGNPGAGAAIGAGSGLVLGSAGGVQASGASAAILQSRYDMAYVQCMYAKGHQVPSATVAPSVRAIPPPPPPGLPPPPPPGVVLPQRW